MTKSWLKTTICDHCFSDWAPFESKTDALSLPKGKVLIPKTLKKEPRRRRLRDEWTVLYLGGHWHYNGDSKQSRYLVWKSNHKQLLTLIELESHLFSDSTYLLTNVIMSIMKHSGCTSQRSTTSRDPLAQQESKQLPINELHPFPTNDELSQRVQ